MKADEIKSEVVTRFGMAVSMLVRGAVDEMNQRGLDRAEASVAVQEALSFVLQHGPQPLGEGVGVGAQGAEGQAP